MACTGPCSDLPDNCGYNGAGSLTGGPDDHSKGFSAFLKQMTKTMKEAARNMNVGVTLVCGLHF